MTAGAARDVRSCPGCGASDWREIDPGDPSFVLLRCRTCECEALLRDRPDPSRLYEDYYATAAAQRVSGPFDLVWKAFRRGKAGRILARGPSRPRILDVGCERGELLDVLRRYGCDVAGTQISASAAAYARRRFGIDVFVGELSAAPYARASFDAVLMLNVLEHLPDPERYVADVARLLRAEGSFWIELPNPRSFTARLARKRWLHAQPEHHFWAFSEAGLRRLLARHDMRVESVDHWSWEHGPIGCMQSWLNFVPGPRDVVFGIVVDGLRADRLPLQLIHGVIGALLILPALLVSTLESASGNGQVMRLRARRLAATAEPSAASDHDRQSVG